MPTEAYHDRLRNQMLAREAARLSQPPPEADRRGRPQTASTKRKLSAAQFQCHKARAINAGGVSRIRRERWQRGLTISAAAQLALIAPRTFQRAERDPDSVAAPTVRRIAAAFKVSPSELAD